MTKSKFMTMDRVRIRASLLLLAFLFLTAEIPTPWAVDELAGKKAPDFTLKDVNDVDVSLSSFQGKTVLINFWATWCPPCREEMPSLNKLYREYRNQGLVVLAVSTDRRMGDVRGFVKKNSYDFPVLMDPDMKTSRQYKVFSTPTTFLIDRSGVIIKRYLGGEEWDSPEIRSEIKRAIGAQ